MNALADRKQRLLSSGMAVVFRNGYNGTGVQDIVDAAGVPKGSFYNYFDSKEAFAVEGLSYLASETTGYARELLGNKSISPSQRLIKYFERACADQQEKGYSGGCIVGNLCQELADVSETVRARVNALMGAEIDLIAEVLSEARENGELAPDQDPADAAEYLFCAWEGTLMRMKASKDGKPLETFLRVMRQMFSAPAG